MNKTLVNGAILASAVAFMFVGSTAMGAGPSSGSPAAQVKCIGGNSCKGQSACKTATSSCSGENSCKGKGWIMTTSVKECEAKGGHPAKM